MQNPRTFMVCEVTAIIPFPATDKRFLDELASSLFFFFLSSLSPPTDFPLFSAFASFQHVGIARSSVGKLERRAGATFTYRFFQLSPSYAVNA